MGCVKLNCVSIIHHEQCLEAGLKFGGRTVARGDYKEVSRATKS